MKAKSCLLIVRDIRTISANRRHKASSAYMMYKQHLATLFAMQLPKDFSKMAGPYKITIGIETFKDADNTPKPILDALKEAGIIYDDSVVVFLPVWKVFADKGAPENLAVKIEKIRPIKTFEELLTKMTK